MSAPNPNDPVWAEQIASQTINLTDTTGNVDTFTLPEIDEFFHEAGRSLIIFGVNIGMSVMVAVVLLLLTKADKRRTPIFALNIASLSLQFIRMVMVSILYNGPNKTIEVAFLYTNVLTPQSAFVPAYIYIIVTMFWYIVIITSIILQVRVVFSGEPRVQKYLTYALGLLGLSTIGFVITDQSDIFKGSLAKTGQDDVWEPWVELVGRILYTVTVGISSGIFVAKLLYLIHRRRKMGFRGFGPLQVIVIMGAQCLLVPCIFQLESHANNSGIYDCRLLC
jgi:pheromone alpha factor receptor